MSWTSLSAVFFTSLAAFVGAFLSPLAKETIGFFSRSAQLAEKARDDDINLLVDVVFEIRDLSIIHWSLTESAEGAEQRRAAITGRLHLLGLLITDVFLKDIDEKRNVDIALTNFRKSTSGGQFGSSNRQAQPENTSDIEINAYQLVRVAQRSRAKLKRKFLS